MQAGRKTLGWHFRVVLELAAGALLILLICPEAFAEDVDDNHIKPWYGAGSWGTLSSLFFLLSAVFADLLLMRFMLVLAYISLLVAALLGFPNITTWTYVPNPLLLVGAIAWASVSLALHVWAFLVLLLDERPIHLAGREAELWRCFYRRCGMARLEFKQVSKCGQWRHYKAGDVIEERGVSEPLLYLVYEGCVRLQPGPDPAAASHPSAVTLRSGQLVNKYLCNLFGIFLGFESEVRRNPWAIAVTDVTCFTWDIDALLKMSSGSYSVALPSYWRSFQLYQVGAEFCQIVLEHPMYFSSGELELPEWLEGAASQDYVLPLASDEQDRPSVKAFCTWVLKSLNPWPPVGLRHHAKPKTGALASARVLLASQLRQSSVTVPLGLERQVSTIHKSTAGLTPAAAAAAGALDHGWNLSSGSAGGHGDSGARERECIELEL